MQIFRPGAPDSLQAIRISCNLIKLDWSVAGEANADGFVIERKIADSEYKKIAKVKSVQREFYDKIHTNGLDIGDVDYRIHAFNRAGNSPYVYTIRNNDLIGNVEYVYRTNDYHIHSNLVCYPENADPWKFDRYGPVARYPEIFRDVREWQNHFRYLPAYLHGCDYLKTFKEDSNFGDRNYLEFTANKNLILYLVTASNADVDDGIWHLIEKGVNINPYFYPGGVWMFTQEQS